MPIYEFEGKRPVIGKRSFVHPQANIIGDVKLGPGCYVGAGACIRGDWGSIVIGEKSNIQENCVIHVGPEVCARMGNRSHIGHGAILHSPNLGEHVLVGMGAIIMDWSTIGDGCVIGAGALVPERMEIPPFKLAVGMPAKIIADIDEKKRVQLEEGTGYYIGLPPRCHKSLREITLAEVLEQD